MRVSCIRAGKRSPEAADRLGDRGGGGAFRGEGGGSVAHVEALHALLGREVLLLLELGHGRLLLLLVGAEGRGVNGGGCLGWREGSRAVGRERGFEEGEGGSRGGGGRLAMSHYGFIDRQTKGRSRSSWPTEGKPEVCEGLGSWSRSGGGTDLSGHGGSVRARGGVRKDIAAEAAALAAVLAVPVACLHRAKEQRQRAFESVAKTTGHAQGRKGDGKETRPAQQACQSVNVRGMPGCPGDGTHRSWPCSMWRRRQA